MLYVDDFIVKAQDLYELDEDGVRAVEKALKIKAAQAAKDATAEFTVILTSMVQQFGVGGAAIPMSDGHLAAVFNTGIGVGFDGTPQQRVKLSQIVTHNAEAQALNSTIQTIARAYAAHLFFTRAAAKRPDEKYSEQAEYYKKVYTQWLEYFRQQGLAYVMVPLPAPGAVLWPGAGVFDVGAFSQTDSSGAAGVAWDVAITWVAGSIESAPSARATMSTDDDNVGVVSIANLTPPDGTPPKVGISQGVVPPAVATGWHVYAAEPGKPLRRQTADPLPLSTQAFTFAAELVSGPLAGPGQAPDGYLPMPRRVL